MGRDKNKQRWPDATDPEPVERGVLPAPWALPALLEPEDINTLEEMDYDGIRGLPPEWVPPATIARFKEHRAWLLENVELKGDLVGKQSGWLSAEQVKLCLDLYDEDDGIVTFPPTMCQDDLEGVGVFVDSIRDLAELRRHVRLGPKEGQQHLAGDNAVRGQTDKASRCKGAAATNDPFKKSADYCVKAASDWWSEDLKSGESPTRIGELCDELFSKLEVKGHARPSTPTRIRKWLKDAEKKGKLRIPPDATKPGAPQKKRKK